MAKPAVVTPLTPGTVDWIARRRKALAESAAADRIPKEITLPHEALGLALSGGGIRSATIALGLVQALARRDRLFDFDYMSTVSGGGYFGSFLGSLFTPMAMRGPPDRTGAIEDTSTIDWKMTPAERRSFVEYVLGSDANEDQIWCLGWEKPREGCHCEPQQCKIPIRSPVWWLREHGRYLAPNGPTDYMYAVASISRNWLAMLYTFFIAATAAFCLLTLASDFAISLSSQSPMEQWLHICRKTGDKLIPAHTGFCFNFGEPSASLWQLTLSPLLILPVIALVAAAILCCGYWVTVSLDTNSRWSQRPKRYLSPLGRFWAQFAISLVIGSAAAFAAAVSFWRWGAPPGAQFDFVDLWDVAPALLAWPWLLFPLGAAMITLGAVCAGGFAMWTRSQVRSGENDMFTSELRRRLTKATAIFGDILLWTLALALIDTVALSTSWLPSGGGASATGLLAIIAGPIAAWLFKKIPEWLGDSRVTRLLGEHVWTVALIAGAGLFALVAFGADALVQYVFWYNRGAGWEPSAAPNWALVVPFCLAAFMLAILTGWSSGFINLSSLFNLYAGRLTRAYVGASNLDRLMDAVPRKGDAPITENHDKDFIDIARYCSRDIGDFSPIHLINATLNETRSRDHSQLTDRDRKGIPIVFAPEGVRINAARSGKAGSAVPFDWDKLRQFDVDSLELGQLCGISGAAASSGMGSRTTLGGALAFTFANIRLGYWWVVNSMIAEGFGIRPVATLFRKGPLATFYYFFNEMTARYSLSDDRVYLSDGGHFENSGAYELLRRRVKIIVVCDNGQDEHFQFEDLENLVRKARIDLGFGIAVLPAEDAELLLGKESAALFLNSLGDEWRARAGDADTGCALLLGVYQSGETHASAKREQRKPRGYIIWLKPKLVNGLPQDVRGYAARNPGFPQQTTGDQFFDEAQWESYRAVGFVLGERLLTETYYGNDALRTLASKLA